MLRLLQQKGGFLNNFSRDPDQISAGDEIRTDSGCLDHIKNEIQSQGNTKFIFDYFVSR